MGRVIDSRTQVTLGAHGAARRSVLQGAMREARCRSERGQQSGPCQASKTVSPGEK